MSNTAAESAHSHRLQTRPALQLAVGSLPATEQGQVQISLRVIAARLPMPCVAVAEVHGDITLEHASGRDTTMLTSAYGRREIERPIRLVPLADALSELIEEILAREDGLSEAPVAAAPLPSAPQSSAAAATEAAPATPQPANTGIGALLVNRPFTGPLAVHAGNGLELLVDADYHTAWSPLDDAELVRVLAGSAGVCANAVAPADFAKHIRPNAGLNPVAVEQLAWLAPVDATLEPVLARWLADPQARLTLVSWPNLSLQADYPQWLELLSRLAQHGHSVAEAIPAGQRAGIAPARLRQGLALLCVFKHALLERGAAAASPRQPAQPVSEAAREAAGSGLLGRLKSRFRSLMGG